MPLGEFPSVVRWHDRLNELEAWRNPFPSRQTEAAAAWANAWAARSSPWPMTIARGSALHRTRPLDSIA